MKIGIVGHGVVGSAVARYFDRNSSFDVIVYDKHQLDFNAPDIRREINSADLVFICVPTPTAQDGMQCDLSAVEECVQWVVPPMCIRSTVPPGTTDRLSELTGKHICFSPEYLGEQPQHPWHDEGACGFLIVGGPPALCRMVSSAYAEIPGSLIDHHHTTARIAETCKYMENCFLATKVAFVNQFYDIASSLNVDFEELRNLWLLDPRVGVSHARVTSERGFRGRCLPKDIAAITAIMEPFGGAPLLRAIIDYNAELCERSDASASPHAQSALASH